MKAKFVNDSLNEARKIELSKFNKGDILVATKEFSLKDLNFKKSAKSWWGQNVYPYKKEWGNRNYTYKPGEIIFMAVTPTMGYKLITSDYDSGKGELSKYTVSIQETENEYEIEQFTLMELEGYAEKVPYNSLSEEKRKQIEAELKSYRVWKTRDILNKDVIIDGKYEIIDAENKPGGTVYRVVDVNSNQELPNIYVRINKILTTDFKTSSGKEITGDPFDSQYLYV